MVATGYYGLLRIGELTAGTHSILACNVLTAKNKNKIQLVLKTSKTHAEANYPQKVTIVKNVTEESKCTSSKSNKYCPYEIFST